MRNKSHQTARAPEAKAATGNAQEVAESFEEKGLRARHRARDAVAAGRLSDDRYRRGRGD